MTASTTFEVKARRRSNAKAQPTRVSNYNSTASGTTHYDLKEKFAHLFPDKTLALRRRPCRRRHMDEVNPLSAPQGPLPSTARRARRNIGLQHAACHMAAGLPADKRHGRCGCGAGMITSGSASSPFGSAMEMRMTSTSTVALPRIGPNALAWSGRLLSRARSEPGVIDRQ